MMKTMLLAATLCTAAMPALAERLHWSCTSGDGEQRSLVVDDVARSAAWRYHTYRNGYEGLQPFTVVALLLTTGTREFVQISPQTIEFGDDLVPRIGTRLVPSNLLRLDRRAGTLTHQQWESGQHSTTHYRCTEKLGYLW